MGNCVGQTSQKEFLRLPLAARDPQNIFHNNSNDSSFRVFVKKRNKFVPGTLNVSSKEIAFWSGRSHCSGWPLHFLRRYGFTSAGIFFFESGRRCPGGEGLHTFQSHQAETIFQLVQSKIQVNANNDSVLRGRRADSLAGSMHSLMSAHSIATSRIHPVQRYSSEGTTSAGDFSMNYNSYHSKNCFINHYNAIEQSRRPRSIATAASGSALWSPTSSNSYQRGHYNVLQPTLLGKIVNEHVITRQPSILNHSYVNVLPPNNRFVSIRSSGQQSKESIAASFSGDSVSDCRPNTRGFLFRPSPVYRSVSESNSPSCDRFFYDRYVNLNNLNIGNERDTMPALLDYAAVDVGIMDNCACVTQRTNLPNGRNDPIILNNPTNINYTMIDLEKTHAVEIAANVLEKENPQRRHYAVGI